MSSAGGDTRMPKLLPDRSRSAGGSVKHDDHAFPHVMRRLRGRCTPVIPVSTVAALGNEVTAQMPDATSATVLALPRENPNMLAAEQVAKVVAGIPTIGEACDALRKAGWRAGIAGNRITVNDKVFAQFIGATVGGFGGIDARWVVNRIAGTPPVWIVGAGPQL
jgi:hypothetical protein